MSKLGEHIGRASLIAGSVILVLVSAAHGVRAAEPAGATPPPVTVPAALSPETVVATVDGQPIVAGEVLRTLTAALHGSQLAPEARAFALAQALEQVIQRRLVVAVLDAQKFVVADEEINTQMKVLERQAAATNKSLDAFLAERGATPATAREQIAWETRWSRFARQSLGDQEVQKYFTEHSREFDGSEVRCSHILLRPVGGSGGTPQVLTQRAAALREEIVDRKLTFADAARQYSSGPSRTQGGDLGYIPRHGRMVEPFSAAAFALEPDAISPPVITYFGVHLIQCTDIKPGRKTWQEVRGEVLAALAQQLFQKTAREQRAKSQVEYTSVLPHFDPQTGNLTLEAGNTSSAK